VLWSWCDLEGQAGFGGFELSAPRLLGEQAANAGAPKMHNNLPRASSPSRLSFLTARAASSPLARAGSRQEPGSEPTRDVQALRAANGPFPYA
jgi:hypothetical protein